MLPRLRTENAKFPHCVAIQRRGLAFLRSLHGDGNGLRGIVPVTISIPSAQVGLPIAFRVRRIGSQDMPARVRCVPCEFPGAPRMRRYGRRERRVTRRLGAVHPDLDSHDHTLAGPRLASHDHWATAYGIPVPGRDDDRADAHRANRARRVAVLVIVYIPAELVVTPKRLRESLDPLEPFHAGHAVPARDDQPNRPSVLPEDRPAVHLDGEERVRGPRLPQREGPPERNLVRDVRWASSVRADGEDFNRVRSQAYEFQEGAQGNARPSGCAHRAEPPRLPRRERRESGATVPRALERHRHGASAYRLEVGRVQPQSPLDRTDDLQNVPARRQVWPAEVTPHKEPGFRRQVVSEVLGRAFRIEWLGPGDSHPFLPALPGGLPRLLPCQGSLP